MKTTPPAGVAIVGMSCMFPGAPNLQAFWTNILRGVDALQEVPAERWDWRAYFDVNRPARDRISSKWGGFLEPVLFDPTAYGIPPKSLASIEPLQLLLLLCAEQTLQDAGCLERSFPRERTAVIVGAGGVSELGERYMFRANQTRWGHGARDANLPAWSEDSFPGILMNVAAGRISNRFDLGGPNYTVDAACGSSLAALHLAVRELESEESDLVLCGAAETSMSPYAFLSFSQTHALSPTGRCRPFDADGDGIAISEGVAMLALKRLPDAVDAGDRIYATIQGVGGGSDGKDKSLTAPNAAGQLRTFRRAYARALVSPSTIGLVEAHGTGTAAGDASEWEALNALFRDDNASHASVALGSVKSMIGHTRAAAGMAGVIKSALALYHRVLPKTLHVHKPIADDTTSPLFINTDNRPWFGKRHTARRAAVSAFGFGGTNFHAVLEEPAGEEAREDLTVWDAELVCLRATDDGQLCARVDSFIHDLEEAEGQPLSTRPTLYEWASRCSADPALHQSGGASVSVLATSCTDLLEKIRRAKQFLEASSGNALTDTGLWIRRTPLDSEGRVAFLFPGQGSQRVGMLNELALAFPELREVIEQSAGDLSLDSEVPLLSAIFPPPAWSEEEIRQQHDHLTRTDIAQPALAVVEVASSRLLARLGIRPSWTAGHSFGEFTALWQAGVFDRQTLLQLAVVRGKFMREASGGDAGGMVAVAANPEVVSQALKGLNNWVVANLNAPTQTVISGPVPVLSEALSRLQKNELKAKRLPVSCAFHSPWVSAAGARLGEVLEKVAFQTASLPVFSNVTAQSYPEAAAEMRQLLTEHLLSPVNFVGEIENLYAHGARVFVEVGPGAVLTALTKQILQDKPHLSVPMELSGVGATTAFLHMLAKVFVSGAPLRLERLFQQRRPPARGPQRKRTQVLLTGDAVRPVAVETVERPLPSAVEAPRAELRAGIKFTPTCIDWPLQKTPRVIPPGVVVVTDDGRGVAPQLIAQLEREGIPAAMLDVRRGAEDADSRQTFERRLVALEDSHGAIGGLIHLAPLRRRSPFFGRRCGDDGDMGDEALVLFHLACLFGPKLAAHPLRQPFFFGVTGFGGGFGIDAPASLAEFAPAQAGVSGLLKSLSKEWTGVRVRAIDVDARAEASLLASHLKDEIFAFELEREIGYLGDRRVSSFVRPSSLRSAGPSLALGPDSVVLVTGGARGITAQATIALIEKFGCQVVLCGRSASPLPEALETQRWESQKDLRSGLVGMWRRRGKEPKPRDIENECGRIMANREGLRTLSVLRRIAARVDYVPIDIRDGAAVKTLVQRLYAERGRVDVLIHGAGVIEDKLLVEKTEATFRAVFETKVQGLLNLIRHLRPESLQCLALFSSVASHVGGAGQADYSAANDVMNKMALGLDRVWPGRVVSLGWGPWADVGMVRPEVRTLLESLGVTMVSPEEGSRYFVEEVTKGGKGDVEMVVGEGVWRTRWEQRHALRDEVVDAQDEARIMERLGVARVKKAVAA